EALEERDDDIAASRRAHAAAKAEVESLTENYAKSEAKLVAVKEAASRREAELSESIRSLNEALQAGQAAGGLAANERAQLEARLDAEGKRLERMEVMAVKRESRLQDAAADVKHQLVQVEERAAAAKKEMESRLEASYQSLAAVETVAAGQAGQLQKLIEERDVAQSSSETAAERSRTLERTLADTREALQAVQEGATSKDQELQGMTQQLQRRCGALLKSNFSAASELLPRSTLRRRC
ncbi:hypothetical protein CYMTET_34296, partial [Cymbomonas tetramitiformis]